jgi:hypothetical protein
MAILIQGNNINNMRIIHGDEHKLIEAFYPQIQEKKNLSILKQILKIVFVINLKEKPLKSSLKL